MKITNKYVFFAGKILRRAWCSENNELYQDEEALTNKEILRIAKSLDIDFPLDGFAEFRRGIEAVVYNKKS